MLTPQKNKFMEFHGIYEMVVLEFYQREQRSLKFSFAVARKISKIEK